MTGLAPRPSLEPMTMEDLCSLMNAANSWNSLVSQEKQLILPKETEHLGFVNFNTFLQYVIIAFYSNWGTENDDSQSYHNGNSDPRGFGRSLVLCLQFLSFEIRSANSWKEGNLSFILYLSSFNMYTVKYDENE